MLKDKLKEIDRAVTDRYRQITQRVKDHIESEIRQVIEKTMKQLLRRIRRFTRKSLASKEMFSCVKDTLDDLFDDLWPELENEIMYGMRLQFDIIEEYKKPEKTKKCCFFYCLSRIRAAYLYALYSCNL